MAYAERNNGVIVNADSAQLYHDIPVLSAAPTVDEPNRVEHRLYGVLDGAAPCSAADWAAMAKLEIADITERAMLGDLDFAGALRERVALLQGLDESVVEQCLTERIRANPGASTLIRTMRSRGAETILVSGGFTAFVAPIAERIGFDRFEANVLGTHNGKLSGLTEGRMVDSRVKHDLLVEARERLGIAANATIAIGDGANDIPMVLEAGLGVAYRAKPALAAVADARIDHHDLSALLWMQAIPRSVWVEA